MECEIPVFSDVVLNITTRQKKYKAEIDHSRGSHPQTGMFLVIWNHFGILNRRSQEIEHCSVSLIWMVTFYGFPHRLKRLYHFVQHSKQYHSKVLLATFHLSADYLIGRFLECNKVYIFVYFVAWTSCPWWWDFSHSGFVCGAWLCPICCLRISSTVSKAYATLCARQTLTPETL